MKTKTILGISALFILFVVVLVTANFSVPVDASQNPASASLLVQITPTLIPDGLSEIGSTDGILIMGVVIVLITMVPVILRKNRN
ncbi:MAG: hypothetical protein K8S20_08600 [Chloroflexi bacterium]|nr:hypothetical protein [Chloroflexota bacterium]